MTRSIEHDGISCAVYTTAQTELAPGGPGLPAHSGATLL